MEKKFVGADRRNFLRYDFNKPLKYNTIKAVEKEAFATSLMDAISKNLSASGILFVTNVAKAPDISSLLALDLDFKTASVCEEIEQSVLVLDNKVIGRVVRIEDNEDGTCGIGVAFLKKSDPLSKDVAELKKIS